MNKIKEFKKNVNKINKLFPSLDIYSIEKIVEQTMCTNLIHDFNELEDWFKNFENKILNVNQIPINQLKNWSISNGKISHNSGKFFEIVGVNVEFNEREVKSGWDQPIIKENNFDGGILGLLRGIKHGLPHYLVEAKFEPGNYNNFQLSPTLQATFSNINKAHGGRAPYYYEYFEDYLEPPKEAMFTNWLSEDGGRLLNKRNFGYVKNVNLDEVTVESENFKWFSLFQIKKFINIDAIVNPHLMRLIFL